MKTFDFTTWRKGTVVRAHNGKVAERIGICPICGRKGSICPSYIDGSGIYHPIQVIHAAHLSMGLLFVDDLCQDWEAFGEIIAHAARRSLAARKCARQLLPDTDWPALPFEAGR